MPSQQQGSGRITLKLFGRINISSHNFSMGLIKLFVVSSTSFSLKGMEDGLKNLVGLLEASCSFPNIWSVILQPFFVKIILSYIVSTVRSCFTNLSQTFSVFFHVCSIYYCLGLCKIWACVTLRWKIWTIKSIIKAG